MKLITLISADIYRDGGSLEATWLSDEQKEWALCLHVRSWRDPHEAKTYHLYMCKLNERTVHQRIEKNSAEHQQIIKAVEAWALANQILPEEMQKDPDLFSVSCLLSALRAGNY